MGRFLPPEIHWMVISHVDDTSTLHSLLSTSKALHAMAKPRFEERYVVGDHSKTLLPFALRVARRPDLAAKVKHLAIGKWTAYRYGLSSLYDHELRHYDHETRLETEVGAYPRGWVLLEQTTTGFFSSDRLLTSRYPSSRRRVPPPQCELGDAAFVPTVDGLLELMGAVVPALGWDAGNGTGTSWLRRHAVSRPRTTYYQGLASGNPDALVQFLLAVLPNLESVSLRLPRRPSGAVDRLGMALASRKDRFRQLRTVELAGAEDDDFEPVADYLNILGAPPGLQHLRLECLRVPWYGARNYSLRNHTRAKPPIECLELVHCDCGDESFSDIMSCLRRCRRLKVRFDPDNPSQYFTDGLVSYIFDNRLLLTHLDITVPLGTSVGTLERCETLVSLHIPTYCLYNFDHPTSPCEMDMGLLVCRGCNVSACRAYGKTLTSVADLLPHGLEELQLQTVQRRHAGPLRPLGKVCATHFPRLRLVELQGTQFSEDVVGEGITLQQTLHEAFEEGGMVLQSMIGDRLVFVSKTAQS